MTPGVSLSARWTVPLSLLLAATPAAAQRPDTLPVRPTGGMAQAPGPCCVITAVDSLSHLVSARESSTGYRFRFAVRDPKLRVELKVGQKIWADFAANRVSLRPGVPCCEIVPDGRPPDDARP